jgi:trimethyllysine dioxygenase
VDSFALAPDLRPSEVVLAEAGSHLEMTWPEGHKSRFSARFLRVAAAGEAPPERALWDAGSFPDGLPSVDYAAVTEGEEGLLDWLQAVERHGFCLLRGAPATPEATRALAERIGYIRKTIFGSFWDFTADLAHKDTAYTRLAIGPHTDGTYSRDGPGLQMLHCLAFDGSGGESVLVDGFKVAEELRRRDPPAFEVLARIRVPGQYVEPGIHLRAERPVLSLDPRGGLVQVSFNNHDRAPFRLPDDEMTAFYDALRAFAALAADPALQARFQLEPGAPLLFDNWRVLHGRTAYEGRRRLCGCYLNREVFESRLRVLRGKRAS